VDACQGNKNQRGERRQKVTGDGELSKTLILNKAEEAGPWKTRGRRKYSGSQRGTVSANLSAAKKK